MSFLKRFFGSGDSSRGSDSDAEGFFLYVQCDQCDDRIRLRVHKQHELNRTEEGYVWHKTIVDNRCFQPMHTVVHLDQGYNVITSEIDGGHFISREEYEGAGLASHAGVSQPTDAEETTG